MRCLASSRFFFALGEEPVHLVDDRFQLPGVSLISGPLLELTPTLGFPGKIGPLGLAELRSWHRRPPPTSTLIVSQKCEGRVFTAD